jgi:hypothetical protein
LTNLCDLVETLDAKTHKGPAPVIMGFFLFKAERPIQPTNREASAASLCSRSIGWALFFVHHAKTQGGAQ